MRRNEKMDEISTLNEYNNINTLLNGAFQYSFKIWKP